MESGSAEGHPVPAGRGFGILGSLGELVFPVLLTLIPLLIMLSGSAWERDFRLEEGRREWLDRTSQASRRFYEASTPEFWVEWSLHRVVKTADRAFAQLARTRDERRLPLQTAAKVLAMARERSRLAGVPESRIWALSLRGGNEATGSGDLLKAPGLESDLRYVMVRLLREIGRIGSGEPPDFERGQWPRLLEQLFGFGVTGDLFMADMRGKAFPVTFHGQTRTACWDIVNAGRQGAIVVLAVSPLRPEMVRTALRLSIRHWERIGRGSRARPFAVPLASLNTKGVALDFTHPSVASGEWREIIGGIQREMRLVPGIDLTRQQQQALDGFPSYVAGGKRFGRIQLPVGNMGKVLEAGQGHWWYRFFPLVPKAMAFGGFLAPAQHPETGPIGRWTFRLALIWVIGWSGIVLLAILSGRLPAVPVHASLILWFLALVLLPVSQGIVTGAKFSADLQRNLLDEGFSRLRAGIERLEASSSQLNTVCLRASREITQRESSGTAAAADLYRVQFASQPVKPFFDNVWRHFEERGLGLSGAIAFGHRGFTRSRFVEGTAHRIASATQYLASNLVQPNLNDQITPALQKRGIVPTISPLGEIQRQRPEMILFDAIYSFGVGPKRLIGYISRLFHEDEVYHFLMVFWEQERLYGRWLTDWIRANPLPAGQGIMVFRASRAGVEAVASGGVTDRLQRWVGGRDDEERLRETRDRLVLSSPSRAFPGMRYVIAMSSDWISHRLLAEQRNLAVQTLLLIFLVCLAGWFLSEWLASPIESMTAALRKVAVGNVGIHLGLRRSDELGDAAGALDTMIGWLRERVKMGRFVAPQVLDVVAGGDLSRVAQGTAREVVVLVSDLRGFTTISETRSPEEVFQLLNGHLERMTGAIQKAGGVIDRFIGDAIQAVFYVEDAGDGARVRAARHAIEAACAMVHAHRQYNRERLAAGAFAYEIGIGIDLGRVVTGVLGDPESRLDFTVLGDVVRSAGDLEAASKKGTLTRIICPDAVRRLVPELRMVRLDSEEPAWELDEFKEAEPEAQTVGRTESALDPNPATNLDLEQKSGTPPVASPGTGNLGWAVFLLLWSLPVFLIGAAFSGLCEEERRRLHDIETTRVTREAKLLEKINDPRALLTWHLQELLGGIGRKAREEALAPAAQAREFGDTCLRLRTLLPSLEWAIIEPQRQERLKRHYVSEEDWKLVAMTGERYLLSSEAVPTIALISLPLLFNGCAISAGLDLFAFSGMSRIFGPKGNDLSYFEKALFGQWGEVTIRGRRCLMFWDVLSPMPEWKASVHPPHRIDRGDFFKDPPLSTYHQLVHGVLLFLDPADLTPDVVKRLLEAIFKGRGTRLRFSPAAAGETQIQSGIGLPDTVTAEANLRLEKDDRVTLSRAIPSADRFTRLKRLFMGLGLLWICVLVAFFGMPQGSRVISVSGRGAFGLTGRLTGAFVFVLLPAIVLAGLSAERRQFERETRLESDLQRSMENRFERFDAGLAIWSGMFSALLDRELSHSGFREALKRLDLQKQNVAGGIALLVRLTRRMIRCGLLLGSPRLVGRQGQGWELFDSGKRSSKDLMWEFQYLVSKRLLAAYNPGIIQKAGERSENQDLLMGAQIEELTSILRIILDPSDFAGLFFSSFSVAHYGDVRADSTLFVRHLGWESAPAFLFNVSWINENHLLHHAANWSREMAAMLPGNTGIAIGEVHSPLMQYDTPAIRPVRQRVSDGVSLQHLFRPLDRRPGILNYLVSVGREPLMDRIGMGDEQSLFMGRPLRMAVNTVIMGQIPIGRELRSEWLQLRNERIWLGIMLLFAVFLALATARRFIRPVLSLTAGTKAITTGNFAVRLPVDRDDEFGELARAFNSMAAGVQEGRLLSRFVSDSVRQSARDEKHEAAARKGEAVQAVVLFAGLSRFKELLAEVEPERLIENLNRYLESMAREVRGQGGMIDKFIGDKVLAVFFVRDHGGEAAAMAAAVRAARGMQSRMDGLQDAVPSDLGIGLVFGTVLAGIMGTAEVRLESTVIGDPVNLASRLCDVARTRPGGGIVVEAGLIHGLRSSADPAIAADAAHASRLDLTKVKGKSREIEIFILEERGGG